MKILIDNHLLEEELPSTQNFSEFCLHVMNLLLPRKLSIGSCEFDGRVVDNIAEADGLFSRCQICHIASVPLAVALETSLRIKGMEIEKLESDCEALVIQALLAEPQEIAGLWHTLCEGIKIQVNFMPGLGGLLTDQQVDEFDHHLQKLGTVMRELQKAFSHADTVEISDILELQLSPWLREFRGLVEICFKQAVKLER